MLLIPPFAKSAKDGTSELFVHYSMSDAKLGWFAGECHAQQNDPVSIFDGCSNKLCS
jgi:hypothetical protein